MDITTKYGVIYSVENATYYETGELESIRLGKDSILSFITKAGKLSARGSISFYKSGEIRSLEPTYGTRVKTFIGVVNAFDPNAKGESGEENSLQLTKTGEVSALSMVQTGVTLIAKDGARREIVPQGVEKDSCEYLYQIKPIRLRFLRDSLKITDSFGTTEWISYTDYKVQNFTCNKKMNSMVM